MPSLIEIARGKASGYTALQVAGVNGDVDATEETMWSVGAVYAYLTSAEKLKVSSGDAVDAAAGTGARTVKLYGLDADYLEIDETVTMNGVTAVTTTAKFLRIFKAVVITAGTGGKNAGLISIKNNAAAVTLATVPIGLNQSQMAMWTVPVGKTLYMTLLWGEESNNKRAKVRLYSRPLNEVFQLKIESGVNLGRANHRLPLPVSFSAKTDVEMRCLSAGVDADMSGGFDGFYVGE